MIGEASGPGRVRGALRRRRRRGSRLISPTGARVLTRGPKDARARAVLLIPSLFTLANMMCGFVSVLMSFNGHHRAAAVLIGVAVVLDISDGAVARKVGAITPFGLQADSLADLISFGIGPAVLLYTWGFDESGLLGYVVPVFWLTCAAFRLARFNVTVDPLADKRYFTGLPSPGAAGVVLASVFLFDPGFSGAGLLIPIAAGVVPAALMATSYRFMSFRTLVTPKGNGVWVSVVALIAAVVGFATAPAMTGAIIAYGYVLVAPIGWATAPIRRRLFGPQAVAPPRYRLPSVFFPPTDETEDDLDEFEDDEDAQSAELLGEDLP